MSDLGTYIAHTLKPALSNNLDRVFSQFERRGKRWYSNYDYRTGAFVEKGAFYVEANNPTKIRTRKGGAVEADIIELFQEQGGSEFEACVKIAALLGIAPPEENNPEAAKKAKEKKEKIKEAQQILVENLWSGSEQANNVLSFLRGRGWTDDDIKKGRLGCIGSDIKEKLPKIWSTGGKQDWFFNNAIGTEYLLTIPLYQYGEICAFKFRTLNPENKIKYLNCAGEEKGKALYDLTPYNAEGNNCILVEGDLDALHAYVRGVRGVCGTLGGSLTEQFVNDAVRRGYEHYILFFDNDARNDKGQKAGAEYTLKAIKLLEDRGLPVYSVAYGYSTYAETETCKDPDEIISKYGVDWFNGLVENAVSPWVYIADKIIDDAIYKAPENMTTMQFDDCKKGVITLLKRYPQHQEAIKKYIIARFGGENGEAEADLRKQIEFAITSAEQEAATKSKQEKITALSGELTKYVQAGNYEAAAQAAAKFRIVTPKEENEFEKQFADVSEQEFDDLLAAVPEGIPTGLIFEYRKGGYKDGEISVPFLLEQGVTFICAKTGHGKTSFLNMLALNETRRIIENNEQKQILYFSYEVTKNMMFADLLNAFVNQPYLSADKRISPQRAILAYFRGNKNAISSKLMPNSQLTYRQYFEIRLKEFKQHYIKHILKVIECDYLITDLVGAIKKQYERANGKVSVILLDYAQLLYKEGFENRLRTEEIKSIVADLKNLTKEIGVPIVCAVQFNQVKAAPTNMVVENIGEGGDFSRIATTVIGLYNLDKVDKDTAELNALQETASRFGVNFELTDPNPSPNKDNTNTGLRGHALVKLLKGRNDTTGLCTLLDWEGRTKHLSINYPDEIFKDTTPKQESLFEQEPENELPF